MNELNKKNSIASLNNNITTITNDNIENNTVNNQNNNQINTLNTNNNTNNNVANTTTNNVTTNNTNEENKKKLKKENENEEIETKKEEVKKENSFDHDEISDHVEEIPQSLIFFPLNKYKNKELLRTVLPCSASQCFKTLFSNESTVEFDLAQIIGNKDISKTLWKKDPSTIGRVREVKFTTPIKNKFGPKQSR
jgi:hypothetical protein